jgi:Peptidase family M28
MNMKKISLLGLLMITTFFVFGQTIDNLINPEEAGRIEKILSSDEMRGRKVFSPELDKAAAFIAGEFKKNGLETLNGSGSYLQPFVMVQPKFISLDAVFDGKKADPQNIMVITSKPVLTVTEQSGFEMAEINEGANLTRVANELFQSGKNYVVRVDPAFASSFNRLGFLKRLIFASENSVVFVLADRLPGKFSITSRHEITELKLANVVGVIPGKSRKNEYVIFSGHYDHIGVGKAVDGDSIYNGANDDAAGTTAVIMLSKYFKALHNNERTLVFAAFTAEEIGGYGSRYFSRQFDPAKVMAMFNIEMIGTDSKWGNNAAYITGYEKTDMGRILEKNLVGTGFSFHPDPYTDQNLFYRSDNATLARQGVPAHTISTSKMDDEPNYHKPSDELSTLDMNNMAMIIKAIALSSRTIISGEDTPTRVDVSELR